MRTTIEQTILFANSGNSADAVIYGWYLPEHQHTWTQGTRSAICVEIPPSPDGFFLEITWLPYLPAALIRGQSVSISVDGVRIATYFLQREEVAAFYCPPGQNHQRRSVIEFEHPGASRPSEFCESTDHRTLAICFKRLRILRLHDPFPRPSSRKITGHLVGSNAGALRTEAETQAGLPLVEILGNFEAIAGNCDMGLALRELEFERLSLLRFAGATPAVAIRGIENDFEGIGENLTTEVADNPIAEWMIRDGFGLRYHSHQSSRTVSETDVIAAQRRHLTILRRKFLEDVADGEKIFVFSDHFAARPVETALALFIALNRRRPNRMLWVSLDDGTEPGEVHEIIPGLARGNLSVFAPPLIAGHITVGGWLTVLTNAWRLFSSDQNDRGSRNQDVGRSFVIPHTAGARRPGSAQQAVPAG